MTISGAYCMVNPWYTYGKPVVYPWYTQYIPILYHLFKFSELLMAAAVSTRWKDAFHRGLVPPSRVAFAVFCTSQRHDLLYQWPRKSKMSSSASIHSRFFPVFWVNPCFGDLTMSYYLYWAKWGQIHRVSLCVLLYLISRKLISISVLKISYHFTIGPNVLAITLIDQLRFWTLFIFLSGNSTEL